MEALNGKVAVVTGGTRGIGRAIARALASEGMLLMLGARTAADVERTAKELAESTAGEARGVACDVRRHQDCRQLIAETERTFGRLDVLINNAGVGGFMSVEEMPPEEWDRILGTNLDSLFYCCHEAIPALKRAGGGWIINIGSLAGKNAFPRGAAYNASKFGAVGFGEALMQEVRHDGIRVSTIMPGSVATGFSHPRPGAGDDWKVQPEDIAAIVMDLLRTPVRTLPSRVEVRPSQPPRP